MLTDVESAPPREAVAATRRRTFRRGSLKRISSSPGNMPSMTSAHGDIVRVLFDAVPDVERQDAALLEHATCLAKGRAPVGDEHVAERADDGRELAIGKGRFTASASRHSMGPRSRRLARARNPASACSSPWRPAERSDRGARAASGSTRPVSAGDLQARHRTGPADARSLAPTSAELRCTKASNQRWPVQGKVIVSSAGPRSGLVRIALSIMRHAFS